MSFARVYNMTAVRAEDIEHFARRRDNGSRSFEDVVVATLNGAKAAGIDEVALDIDDDEGCLF